MNITHQQLRGIAVEAGIDPDEGVRTDYSGRGMYGKVCVSFDLERAADLMSLGAAILTEGGPDLLDEFRDRARTDSMGLGIVAYFPGITCDDAPEG